MVGGMAGPNAAMAGQAMMGEGAANLGMFGPEAAVAGGLDVNDFLAASNQYAAEDASMAMMDQAFAEASMAGPNVADFAVRPALTASSLLVHVSYSRASRRRRTSKRRRGRAWKTSWLSSRRKAHPWPTLRYGRRVFRFAALSPHRSSALLLRRAGFPGDARPERRRLRRVSGCARAVCRRLCGELACSVSAVLPALVPPAHRAAVPAGLPGDAGTKCCRLCCVPGGARAVGRRFCSTSPSGFAVDSAAELNRAGVRRHSSRRKDRLSPILGHFSRRRGRASPISKRSSRPKAQAWRTSKLSSRHRDRA